MTRADCSEGYFDNQQALSVLYGKGKVSVAAALVLLLLSCGGTAPRINELRWSLNLQFTPRSNDKLNNANTQGSEALSLFIRPFDDDGIEDLDSMYLIKPDEDLFWALDASQWQSMTESQALWIGSNQFSSAYLERMPRGSYLVELYDKAGERDRWTFEVQAPERLNSQVSVPPIGDELLFLLPEDVSLYSIVGYDAANRVLFTDANYQSLVSLRGLKARNDELYRVMLFFEFPHSNVTARLGPYLVPQVSGTPEDLGQALEQEGATLPTENDAETQDSNPIVPETPNPSDASAGSEAESVPIDTYIPTPEELAQESEAEPQSQAP